MTTWSRHSRRTPPRNLSHIGFKSGDRGGIFTTSTLAPSATAANLLPNLPSLSRIRCLGPSPNGVASLSCWAAHSSLGDRVTLKWTTSRLPCLMMKKANIG